MLYFKYEITGKAKAYTQDQCAGVNGFDIELAHLITRNDLKSFAAAQVLAQDVTAGMGETYIATDAGGYCYPQFDVIKLPTVGSPVSKGFNGDYYPCGLIAKVSQDHKRVTTDTGLTFYRRKLSGTWLNERTWSLVAGHLDLRNPSF